MQPTPGRIVLYTPDIRDTEKSGYITAGHPLPCIVVESNYDEQGHSRISGQVFLPKNETLWVVNVLEGTEPGTWAWPLRG